MNDMLTVDVYSASSAMTGDSSSVESKEKLKLDSSELIVDCPQSVVHQVVVWQLGNRRQGTRKAKRKAEVSLSKSKPWKQKGTGRARAGSFTSPLWVGGGVAHGPLPLVFSKKLPKKIRSAALKSVVFDKLLSNNFKLIDSFETFNGKTSQMSAVLDSLGLARKGKKVDSVLVVSDTGLELVKRASKNLPRVEVLPVEGINVYDVLRSKYLLLDKSGLEKVRQRLLGV